MAALRLSLSCGHYDRTLPVLDGTVKPEGIDLVVPPLRLGVSIGSPDADIYETPLPAAIMRRDREDGPLALAVFPRRKFFHQLLLARKDSEIHDFRDFRGKRIGLLRWYQHAMGVWLRGYLKDRWGIAPSEIRWFTERQTLFSLNESQGASHTLIAQDKSLAHMLADGDIDILLHEDAHRILSRHRGLRRVFPGFKQAEAMYFKETGVFPINHVLVIKKEIALKHPWVVPSILRAFDEAKRIALDSLHEDNSFISHPWLHAALEEQSSLLEDDLFPNGVDANRKPLETFVRYLHEQGLISRAMPLEEIFAAGRRSPQTDQDKL